jgi:hypothetical protein
MFRARKKSYVRLRGCPASIADPGASQQAKDSP